MTVAEKQPMKPAIKCSTLPRMSSQGEWCTRTAPPSSLRPSTLPSLHLSLSYNLMDSRFLRSYDDNEKINLYLRSVLSLHDTHLSSWSLPIDLHKLIELSMFTYCDVYHIAIIITIILLVSSLCVGRLSEKVTQGGIRSSVVVPTSSVWC